MRILRNVGRIETEMVLVHTPPNRTASAFVLPGAIAALNQNMTALGVTTVVQQRVNPISGTRGLVFEPIETGRLALLHQRGIGHGDHFRAEFQVKEYQHAGVNGIGMWLVDGHPI